VHVDGPNDVRRTMGVRPVDMTSSDLLPAGPGSENRTFFLLLGVLAADAERGSGESCRADVRRDRLRAIGTCSSIGLIVLKIRKLSTELDENQKEVKSSQYIFFRREMSDKKSGLSCSLRYE
jgi:hypothetical protein